MTTLPLPQVNADKSAGVHRTDIEWCDYAVGGIVRGQHPDGSLQNICIPFSAGCKNCYASDIEERFGGLSYSKQNMGKLQIVVDESRLNHMLRFRPKGPHKNGRTRPSVFLGDMTDMFGDWVPFEVLDRVMAVCALRPDVDWLILTKRPERAVEYLNTPDRFDCNIYETAMDLAPGNISDRAEYCEEHVQKWPLPNVWLGTSVEDQKAADERIPHLLRCPAAVRFLSCEPLLGPVDLNRNGAWGMFEGKPAFTHGAHADWMRNIQWIIVGGESGKGARDCRLAWIDSIIRQCADAGVPCFNKQIGAKPIATVAIEVGSGVVYEDQPYQVTDPKGGDPAEWPEDLRVREMPNQLRGTP